jgi:hypothetical protein
LQPASDELAQPERQHRSDSRDYSTAEHIRLPVAVRAILPYLSFIAHVVSTTSVYGARSKYRLSSFLTTVNALTRKLSTSRTSCGVGVPDAITNRQD